MPRLTTLTVTAPAAWAGMAEMSRLVLLTTVKHPAAAVAQSRSATAVPAANSAAVPISMAVAPLSPVPVILTSPPPPAAPLAGLMLVTVGRAGTVPAGALEDVAGAASADEATAAVLPVTSAEVTLLPVMRALTVIAPVVNVLPVLVHEICWPDGAAHVHPVPDATTGTTPAGSVWVMVTGWLSVAPEAVAVTV